VGEVLICTVYSFSFIPTLLISSSAQSGMGYKDHGISMSILQICCKLIIIITYDACYLNVVCIPIEYNSTRNA
jgi:hypothetical protein